MISPNRCAVIALVACSAFASAQVVDGTRDVNYGSALAVQTVETQFGDANPPGSLGGSELDAAYARVSGGRLYVMLTGNLEPNFNKLNIFIDSVAGGENTLSATPDYDFNGGGGWISSNMGGMTFDAGFEADYHIFGRWGGATDPFSVDFINRNGGLNAMVAGSSGSSPNASGLIANGVINAGNVGPNASGTALTQDLFFAMDNNNAAGVLGGTGAADQVAAAAVMTGFEFSVALADIGNPGIGDTIKISAMVGNGDHNYLSNQFLGGLAGGTGNLGGDGAGGFTGTLSGVDLNQFAGNQYFEVNVVPEPATMAIFGIAALAALRKRKK
ncbi:MAG: PEP-CTERM sorting domain-containing protein [Fimbriimonadaceae bacterium]